MKGLIIVMPDIRTMLAPEYNGRASVLMFENVSIGEHFLAPLVSVNALESDFTEKVSCYSVNFIKLAVASAERTMIGVLGKPLNLAV